MTSRTAVLDHALLTRLSAALSVPLVLHGSSGVPDQGLLAAVGNGIAKVNVGTALNAAMTGAIRTSSPPAPRPSTPAPTSAWAARRWPAK